MPKLTEIASTFLRLGATSYGGPAIMGIFQTELSEKRQWLPKERFLEGLSLVNMLPGATAVQLGIFIGYHRGGWWGGLLAGLAFVLPAFVVMLALTATYASLGLTPILRGALYGLGPVVLGIFVVAVYRLGRSAASTVPQAVIAIVAAVATLGGYLGVATILLLAGAAGLFLFHSKKVGSLAAAVFIVALLVVPSVWPSTPPVPSTSAPGVPAPAGLGQIAVYFFKVGALTVGGGLAMIPFIQDQVVREFRWLTPQEFIDGLALGQFTPGPIMMVSAYVGFKVAGLAGAAVAASAVFMPSFVMMLALLPTFDRVRRYTWMRAVLRGMAPAVIGLLAVSLFRLAPHALPDPFAAVMLVVTVVVLMATRVSTVRAMLAGAVVGVVRNRLIPFLAARAA